MLTEEKDPKDDGMPNPTEPDQSVEKGRAESKDEAEETETIPKKELETLKKKAADFEASIKLKGLLKNRADEGKSNDEDDRIAKLEKNQEALAAKIFNRNLTSAYKKFVAENPWMDDDSKFNKIKDSFNPDILADEEELLSQLTLITRQAFPSEYEKHLEERIKSKIMIEKSKVNADGGTGASESMFNAEDNVKTDEDRMKEKMATLFKKHIPSRR